MRIKKRGLSEPKASFHASLMAVRSFGNPEGAAIGVSHLGGPLSLLTFFGEAKKVSGRRATPG
jgi:hypothetical protein